MVVATMFLLAAALAKSISGVSLDAITSETESLRLLNAFYGRIDASASQSRLAKCNASAVEYLQMRKNASCESASDAFDCNVINFPGEEWKNERKPAACCYEGNWVEASNDHCEDSGDDVDSCCLQCASTTYDNTLEPFDCHAPGGYQFVDAALCHSEENDEGYDPLPTGYECDVAPAIGVGFPSEDDDDDKPPMPDCSQLDHDFAIDRSSDEIVAEMHSENTSLAYKAMRDHLAFLTQPAVAGGILLVSPSAKCVFHVSPRLNGHLIVDEVPGHSENGIVDTLDFRIYNPFVYPSIDVHEPYTRRTNDTRVLVLKGNFTAVAGTSHGVIDIGTAGSVRLQGIFNDGNVSVNDAPADVHMADLTNEGFVRFYGTKNVKMHNISNSGTVEVSGVSATATGDCPAVEDIAFHFVLFDIKNSGIVDFTNGSALLVSVEASESSVVRISNGCFYLADILNEGILTFESGGAVLHNVTNNADVTMIDGSVVATGVVNAGTITIEAGDIDITLKDNTGGSIVASNGVTGTIRLLVGGGEGSVTVPEGVVLSGFSGGDGVMEAPTPPTNKPTKAPTKAPTMSPTEAPLEIVLTATVAFAEDLDDKAIETVTGAIADSVAQDLGIPPDFVDAVMTKAKSRARRLLEVKYDVEITITIPAKDVAEAGDKNKEVLKLSNPANSDAMAANFASSLSSIPALTEANGGVEVEMMIEIEVSNVPESLQEAIKEKPTLPPSSDPSSAETTMASAAAVVCASFALTFNV